MKTLTPARLNGDGHQVEFMLSALNATYTALDRKAPVVSPLAAIVDRLGIVKAQISDLEKESDSLRQQLIEAGVDEAEGNLFRVTVSNTEVSTVDWKTVAHKCEASYQLICAHTVSKLRTTVKVVSR